MRLLLPHLHELRARVLVVDHEVRPREVAVRDLLEAGGVRVARRDPRRVGDHPRGVLQEVVADLAEVVVPEQEARGLRHHRDLALRAQVLQHAIVRSHVRVVEVRDDVAIRAQRRLVVTARAILDLDVRERRVLLVPVVRDLLRRLGAALLRREVGRARIELVVRQVAQRAVGLDVEVAHRDRLHVVDREPGERHHDRAREHRVRRLLQALRRRVRGVIQPADVHRDRIEVGRELRLRDRVDRADVTRGLERDRRQLLGIGVDRERRRQIATAERIDDGVREVFRAQLRDEALGPIGPRVLVRLVDLLHFLAVAIDRPDREPIRNRVVGAARRDAEHRADLRAEVRAGGDRRDRRGRRGLRRTGTRRGQPEADDPEDDGPHRRGVAQSAGHYQRQLTWAPRLVSAAANPGYDVATLSASSITVSPAATRPPTAAAIAIR